MQSVSPKLRLQRLNNDFMFHHDDCSSVYVPADGEPALGVSVTLTRVSRALREMNPRSNTLPGDGEVDKQGRLWIFHFRQRSNSFHPHVVSDIQEL